MQEMSTLLLLLFNF